VEAALAETRLSRERDSLHQLANASQWRDKNVRQLTIAKGYLYRLALITEGLKRNREENWSVRIEEAEKYIRLIADVMRDLSPPAN
jgi:hypothetical protein